MGNYPSIFPQLGTKEAKNGPKLSLFMDKIRGKADCRFEKNIPFIRA